MTKALGTLGLALRAGKLAAGVDAVDNVVYGKKARLVCTAKDAGSRAKEKADNAPDVSNALTFHTALTREQMGNALGMPECTIVALLDDGFAHSFAAALGVEGELLDTLEQRKVRALQRKQKKRR